MSGHMDQAELERGLLRVLETVAAARLAEARQHTLDDCRSAIAEWEAAQPVYLGCGCLLGTHEATMEALHAAHPEVLGWDNPPGMTFYGVVPA